MTTLVDAFDRISAFKTGSLRQRVASLEKLFAAADRASSVTLCAEMDITNLLVTAALLVKRESGQINEVVHAVGILISLPHILEEGEHVEHLSLAAGNTGRPFDLETNGRVAEFKFMRWKGGAESARHYQLFKAFYNLAEYATAKQRFLYVLDIDQAKKSLRGKRRIKSVLRNNANLRDRIAEQYGDQFNLVGDYYREQQAKVSIRDLQTLVPAFDQIDSV